MRDMAPGRGSVRGRIRRRLLVNALVDPDEAARRLPPGLRPHVVDGGTVVGCCLLELERLRPSWAPGVASVTIRAAAHRLSVDWGDGGAEPVAVGVYVPVRHTDSRLAVLAGGRAFPGVHRRAHIGLDEADAALRWDVDVARPERFGLRVVASVTGSACVVSDAVGRACIGATVGLSPGLDGELEGVEMAPAHRRARRVDVEHLDSAFVASFASAEPAPSYLMTDVDVTWRPAPAPAPAGAQGAAA